jgi:hypothetical protein
MSGLFEDFQRTSSKGHRGLEGKLNDVQQAVLRKTEKEEDPQHEVSKPCNLQLTAATNGLAWTATSTV